MTSSLYHLLGVPPTASDAEIKRAYRTCALRYHPDKNQETGASDIFKQLNQAYEVLLDPRLRQIYDTQGEAGLISASKECSVARALAFFAQLWGDLRFRCPKQNTATVSPPEKVQGKDISHKLKVLLAELYTGKEAKIEINRNVICSTCAGSGGRDPQFLPVCVTCGGHGRVMFDHNTGNLFHTVKQICHLCLGSGMCIPADIRCYLCKGARVVLQRELMVVHVLPGLRSGDKIVLEGMSDQHPDMVPGNVVVDIEEQFNPQFRRIRDDLFTMVEIDLRTALCGGVISIPSLTGSPVSLAVPEGQPITPGVVKMLPGRGMPTPAGLGRDERLPIKRIDAGYLEEPVGYGQLVIRFGVRFPDPATLTPEHYAALRRLLPEPAAPSGPVDPSLALMSVPDQALHQLRAKRRHGDPGPGPSPDPSKDSCPGCTQQ